MVAKKKIKEYFTRGVRKLKHRKGFGVHSPFAFDIITGVIEEKLPFYAYQTLFHLYGRQSPIPFKVACLLLRLANRFHCRQIIEIGCDGGYSLLPLVLTDSRIHLTSYTSNVECIQATQMQVERVTPRIQQAEFVTQMPQDEVCYDMFLVHENPFASNSELIEWIQTHATPSAVVFVQGIEARQRLETFWDELCDRDDFSITMDLYNYGLSILKPRFFKQHYIVSF